MTVTFLNHSLADGSLACFPNELLHMVVEHLDPKRRQSIGRVCQIFNLFVWVNNVTDVKPLERALQKMFLPLEERSLQNIDAKDSTDNVDYEKGDTTIYLYTLPGPSLPKSFDKESALMGVNLAFLATDKGEEEKAIQHISLPDEGYVVLCSDSCSALYSAKVVAEIWKGSQIVNRADVEKLLNGMQILSDYVDEGPKKAEVMRYLTNFCLDLDPLDLARSVALQPKLLQDERCAPFTRALALLSTAQYEKQQDILKRWLGSATPDLTTGEKLAAMTPGDPICRKNFDFPSCQVSANIEAEFYTPLRGWCIDLQKGATKEEIVSLKEGRGIRQVFSFTNALSDEELPLVVNEKTKELYLSYASITLKSLDFLAQSSLHSLALHNIQLSDNWLAGIGKISSLNELSLSPSVLDDGNITDAGTAHLSPLSLKVLKLSNLSIGDAAFAAFAKMPLQHLSITGCSDVSGALFDQMAEWRLKEIDLSCSAVGDMGLVKLSSMPFKSVHFSNSEIITDKALKLLSKMPSVRRIYLQNLKNVTAVGLEQLRRCPSLESLRVFHMPRVKQQAKAFQEWLEKTPEERQLHLDALIDDAIQEAALFAEEVSRQRLPEQEAESWSASSFPWFSTAVLVVAVVSLAFFNRGQHPQ